MFKWSKRQCPSDSGAAHSAPKIYNANKKHMEIEIVRPQVHHKVSPRHPVNPVCKKAWPGYTPEKNQIDVGWTTLYPLPSREI